MAGLANTVNWGASLEPTIKAWFHDSADGFPDMLPNLFSVVNSQRYKELYQGTTGISADSWNEFKNSKLVPSVGATPEHEKEFRNEVYTVDLPIEYQLIEDANLNIVQFQTEELAESAAQKRQIDGASVFNNAFSSSFLGADGVALCADSHPSGGGQDNKGTLALSGTNIDIVKVAMQAFKKGSGELAGVMPDLILIPPALEKTAKQELLSERLPGSANNDVNANFGVQYMKWNYLTDSNNWFMIDSRKMKRFLLWISRVPLAVKLDNSKTSPNVAVYNARMRYDYGWIDWRWVYGNEVA